VVVFFGEPRTDAAKHGHDCPLAMTAPLVILALLSIFAGYSFLRHTLCEHLLQSIEHVEEMCGHSSPIFVTILASSAFLVGTCAGVLLSRGRVKDPILIPLFKDKFYIDELYAALIAGSQDLLANLSRFLDQWLIDGLLVRGLSGAAWATGFTLRLLQFGNL